MLSEENRERGEAGSNVRSRSMVRIRNMQRIIKEYIVASSSC